MFKDRKDAGEKLGKALEKYRDKNVLVLGIPRGGVETAFFVAKHLKAELSIAIVRKLGYPDDPEAAFGALAEDGSMYVSESGRQYLSAQQIKDIIDVQKGEIKRRQMKLRRGKKMPNLKDRIVIIVDDGIATGATLLATIEMCKAKDVKKIIVAAPIGSEKIKNLLSLLVDEVIILETPFSFNAVSQGYQQFLNLTDDEALEYLTRAENGWEAK